MSKYKKQLLLFIIVMSTTMSILCGVDKMVTLTWKKYDMVHNSDVERLAAIQVDITGNTYRFISVVSENISPLDTILNFIVPDSIAQGLKYYAVVAIDTAQNVSLWSNIVKADFTRPSRVQNLLIRVKNIW